MLAAKQPGGSKGKPPAGDFAAATVGGCWCAKTLIRERNPRPSSWSPSSALLVRLRELLQPAGQVSCWGLRLIKRRSERNWPRKSGEREVSPGEPARACCFPPQPLRLPLPLPLGRLEPPRPGRRRGRARTGSDSPHHNESSSRKQQRRGELLASLLKS